MATKNPWLSEITERALRCLAFGHAWDPPEEWSKWITDKHPDQRFVYTVKTQRRCAHHCGAVQKTTMYVRTSLPGNIVEVLKTRHRVNWNADVVIKSLRKSKVARPSREEFRLELIRRQLAVAVKRTGTKMRRADAAANITVMLRRQ